MKFPKWYLFWSARRRCPHPEEYVSDVMIEFGRNKLRTCKVCGKRFIV